MKYIPKLVLLMLINGLLLLTNEYYTTLTH